MEVEEIKGARGSVGGGCHSLEQQFWKEGLTFDDQLKGCAESAAAWGRQGSSVPSRPQVESAAQQPWLDEISVDP